MRGSLTYASEGNAEIMGEIPLTHHGDIKGSVQGRNQREAAHVSIIRYHRVGNRSEEVGGWIVRGVGRIVRTIGGLGFPYRGRIEA